MTHFILIFLKVVGNEKHLAIFEIGRANSQNAFRGSLDVNS